MGPYLETTLCSNGTNSSSTSWNLKVKQEHHKECWKLLAIARLHIQPKTRSTAIYRIFRFFWRAHVQIHSQLQKDGKIQNWTKQQTEIIFILALMEGAICPDICQMWQQKQAVNNNPKLTGLPPNIFTNPEKQQCWWKLHWTSVSASDFSVVQQQQAIVNSQAFVVGKRFLVFLPILLVRILVGISIGCPGVLLVFIG